MLDRIAKVIYCFGLGLAIWAFGYGIFDKDIFLICISIVPFSIGWVLRYILTAETKLNPFQ